MIKRITLALALLSFFVMPSFASYSYTSALLCAGPTCIAPPAPPGGGGGSTITVSPIPLSAIQLKKQPTNQLMTFLSGNAQGNLKLDSPITLLLLLIIIIIIITLKVREEKKEED